MKSIESNVDQLCDMKQRFFKTVSLTSFLQNAWCQFWSNALRIGPSRDAMFFGIMFAAVASMFLAYIARMHAVTHDAFHEMALAREWFATAKFPIDDAFSYTSTVRPTVHHEWATGVILYLASGNNPLGLHGLVVLKLLLCAGIVALLYRVARMRGSHPLIFIVLAPLVFPLLWVGFATLRAQIFTLLGIAMQLLMMEYDKRGSRRWVAPWVVMYVVWLNLHAGFVVGIGLMSFHIIEQLWTTLFLRTPTNEQRLLRTQSFEHIISLSFVRSRLKQFFMQVSQLREAGNLAALWKRHWHLAIVAVSIVLGVFINPWGADYITYLAHAIAMRRPHIVEWQPLWMTYDPTTAIVAFMLSVAALLYVISQRQWMRLQGMLFCILAAWMALRHIRHGSIFAILWIAMLPAWITSTAVGHKIRETLIAFRKTWMSAGLVAIAASLAFACAQPFWLATLPDETTVSTYSFPVRLTKTLKNRNARGNIMTPFHCGAYVSWELHPRMKVSLDGRYEVAYTNDVFIDHESFYESREGWESILAKYKHDYVIIPLVCPVYEKIRSAIAEGRLSTWKQSYVDEYFALFERQDFDLLSENHIR